MVQIVPPADWVQSDHQHAGSEAGLDSTGTEASQDATHPPISGRPPAHDEPHRAADGEAPKSRPATPSDGKPAVPQARKPRKRVPARRAAAAGLAAAAPPIQGAASATTPATPIPPKADGVGVPEPPPAPDQLPAHLPNFASPAELLWRKWLLYAVVPLAGLVILAGAWTVLTRRGPQPPAAVSEEEAESESEQPAVQAESAPPGPNHFDLRWVPDGAVMLVDVRACDGLTSAQGRLLLDSLADWWKPAVAAPLRGLRLDLEAVRRVRVVSADLAAWPDRLVLLLELHDGHDANILAARGEAVPIVLGEATCRRLADGWTHPFAVLDERTILTGDEAVLSALAGRNEPQFHSEPVRGMLENKPSLGSADARLLIDLNAARKAEWRFPDAAFDVWPEARAAWHTLVGVPTGLDLMLRWPDRLRSEWTLACESETAAEEVREALERFVPLVRTAVATRAAQLGSAEVNATDAAAAYHTFLGEAATALQSVQWNLDNRHVRIDVDWGAGPWSLATATQAAQASLRADWLDAALAADADRHQRIGAGLSDYQQAEGAWPPGAAGGSLLPPETRLSWIAELLPYFGHADWHRSLRFGYAWNSPQNRGVTRRQLDRFVNPAFGPGRTGAGYPVTHYVGVAGVGPDAATLPADHPRAGVFGFGRRTRLEDIGDGASNVIAILGVAQDHGAWAAGGHATVRPLTTRPYVNGPDGFGSGQLNGMLAGMADGSVRFISKDVDPEVVELLATINSGSNMTVAALGEPAKPQPAVAPGELARSHPVVPEADEATVPHRERARPVADEPAAPPLPAIDVGERLATPVPNIALTDMPLGQAVALLAQLGGMPVTLDPEGLESLGVSLRDSVSVHHAHATLGDVLEATLAERGLVYHAEAGHVLITAPMVTRTGLVRRRYSVTDLAGDATSLQELATVIRELIAPESWQSQGGPGLLQVEDGSLVVEQTAATHHHLLVFCEKLRRARGLPIRSRFPAEWFDLATRRSRASGILQEKLTANFREPAPLVEVLGHLGGLAGADILIDRRALAAEGISDAAPASVAVVDEPFDATLDKLLRPLGLAWRSLDAHTVQVSTQAALDAAMELEFYPVAPLLDGLVTGPTLVEQIRTRIAGPTWSDAGGPGVIHYDAKARCLIVRHNQAVQAAVERLLRDQSGVRR